jgi:hypothetical protein
MNPIPENLKQCRCCTYFGDLEHPCVNYFDCVDFDYFELHPTITQAIEQAREETKWNEYGKPYPPLGVEVT